jgi:hypothetical protein
MSPSPRTIVRAAALLGPTLAAACGGPAPVPGPTPVVQATPTGLDVFHDVYFRGGPAPAGETPRVALTVSGLGACAGPLLARLHEPIAGRPGLPATFFFSPATLDVELAAHPETTRAALARVAAEGHSVALGVDAVPASWRVDLPTFRAGLGTEGRLLAEVLKRAGGPGPMTPLPWRGPVRDGALLGWGSVVDRPQVYWSLHLDVGVASPEALEARVAGSARDGDVLELGAPAGDTDCAWVETLPAIARGLAAAGLRVAPLSSVLGSDLARYEAARLVRFDGPPLEPTCRAALRLPPPAEGPEPAHAARWGLVARDDADGLRVLPLPGRAATLPAVTSGEVPGAAELWARRREWRALPACLVDVSPARRLGPVTTDARVFVVGEAGPSRRDARVVTGSDRPAVLPTREDLVRIEARQRLPWRLRGLVAQTLAGLALETPLLIEARPTLGLVIGRPLTPDAARDPAVLREAIAGYVQFTELSVGEYLFLARLNPADADALARTARAADGFLRAGPYFVLRSPGGVPTAARLGVTGGPTGTLAPESLLARTLLAGTSLSPGDVVVAAPRAVEGGPEVSPDRAKGVGRAAVRRLLAESVLRGTTRHAYLRPGASVEADADLLGAVRFRVVVPPGVHVPDAIDLERVVGTDERAATAP